MPSNSEMREANQNFNIHKHFRTMRGTDHFKTCIKNYLDKRAQEDELFRAKYETTSRTIDDVVTYILNEVRASGCCGFSDDEIYGLAVHVIDEPDIEIGKPITADVIMNHHVELTDEEKAEQKAIALRRFQDAELQKLQSRNMKPKAVKPQENKQPELSLFDL